MGSNFQIIRKRISFITLLLFAIFAICIQPAQAQSQDRQQEIQQLKDKLEQIEQMMNEVKGQIGVLEDESAAGKGSDGGPSNSLVSAVTSLNAYSTAHSYGSATGTPPFGKRTDQKKSVSESTLDIYGFAMTDTGYNFGTIDPNWFDVMRPTKLPAFANEWGPNGQTFFSVRQTRFGVKSSTLTSFGDLKTIFEFDLFGSGVDAGQTTFRLRQAWG